MSRHLDSLFKAATGLRDRLQLNSTDLPGGERDYRLLLGERPVGGMRVGGLDTGQPMIRATGVHPDMQGMGLGKWLYGNVMRQMPGGQLASDSTVSSGAEGLWNSMAQRPNSYTVTKAPEAAIAHEPPMFPGTKYQLSHTGGQNIFQGAINPAAQKPVVPWTPPTGDLNRLQRLVNPVSRPPLGGVLPRPPLPSSGALNSRLGALTNLFRPKP